MLFGGATHAAPLRFILLVLPIAGRLNDSDSCQEFEQMS